MVDAILANRWTKAQDLYRNKKINTIDVSARTIQRMLEELVLGTYQPTRVPFIS